MGDDSDFIQTGQLDVQHTVKFETCVADLATAWSFIMEHVDRVGPDPQISVKPIQVYYDPSVKDPTEDGSRYRREFRVKVSGRIDLA